MRNDYNKRLESLRSRRFDDTLRKAVLSEAFAGTHYGEATKYALESMREINAEYTKNTYVASEKVQKQLLKLAEHGFNFTFRHQGSVETNTHIKLHSDIDLLLILENSFSLESPQTPVYRYQGDPLADLKSARENSFQILNNAYNQVDDSKPKAIQVFPTSPKRKVDVVIANWHNSNEYVQQSQNEVYRGIRIYNKVEHSRSHDFPFLNIARINSKDSFVNGGIRKLVRMLKTLKVDADYTIDLSSFEITSLDYDIDQENLNKTDNKQLYLLNEASDQLSSLINSVTHRDSLASPNQKELVFNGNPAKVVELKKLKTEVDDLRSDIIGELNSGLLTNERIESDVYY